MLPSVYQLAALALLFIGCVRCEGSSKSRDTTPHPGEDCLPEDSDPPICNLWVNPDTLEPVFIRHDFNCSRFWVCGPDLEYCLFECPPLGPGFEPDTNLYFDWRIQYPDGPVCNWPDVIPCEMQNNTCSSITCDLYPCNTCVNGECTTFECCTDDHCQDPLKPICTDHVCGAECIENEDCDGYNNVCNPDYSNCNWCDNPDGNGGECEPGCIDDDNCEDGQSCNNHKCEENCASEECCENEDCGGCNECNSDFTCTNFQCCGNSDCTQGLPCNVCTDHMCSNYECCDDPDCSAGEICDDHTCVAGCREDQDCWDSEPPICEVANYENCNYCKIDDGKIGECTPGCSIPEDNCPDDMKCTQDHICQAPGRDIIEGFKIFTKSCEGCSGSNDETGLTIYIKNGLTDDPRSCTTNMMDHGDQVDYAPNSEVEFLYEENMGASSDDNVSLGACGKADIGFPSSGTVTWNDDSVWSPADKKLCYKMFEKDYFIKCDIEKESLGKGESSPFKCGGEQC